MSTRAAITLAKTYRLALAWVLLSGSLAGSAIAVEPVQSGLQPGEKLFAVFEPLNITGPFAGEPHCLVCENGANPVAMVFARDLSEPLTRLLTKLDAATAEHRRQEMGSFVIFLSDDEKLPPRLQETAAKHALKHIILATDAPAGPDGFKVSGDAEVTVVLYREHRVLANHAFRRGELNERAIDKILADLPKINAVQAEK